MLERFKRESKPKYPERPYDLMHAAIVKKRNRNRRWQSGAYAAVNGLMSAFAFVFTADLSWLDRGGLIFAVTVIGFLWLFILRFFLQNLSPSDTEIEFREIGLDFLKVAGYEEVTVDVIDRQAEVGASTAPNRTMVQSLSLPIALPLLGLIIQKEMLPYFWFFFGVFIMPLTTIILSFLVELDRAHIDSAILNAIAVYRGEVKQKNPPPKPQTQLDGPPPNGSHQKRSSPAQQRQPASRKKRR